MVGNNTNRWSPEKIARMAVLRLTMTWDEVAIEIGHPKASCQTMHSKARHVLRRAAMAAERKALRAAADTLNAAETPAPPKQKPPPAPPVRAAEPDYARSSISTAKLVMDAELRSRIEVIGITGGLLGDPPPGRSALDDRRRLECGGSNGTASGTGPRR